MPIPCAVLMCHAPIVIPEIAGPRASECAQTTAAMRQTARRLVAHAPDVLVIVSPHAPRDRRRWGIADAGQIAGDFGRFGVPEIGLTLPGAPSAAAALARAAHALGLTTWRAPGAELDHGALVPLYFVREAGWLGPTLLVALPYPGTGSEATMGRAIAEAAALAGERWAVLASGDMSHRLTPDAPAGYDPRARDFDARFRELVAAGDLRGACAVDPDLRELAAEDVVDSCVVAAGAVSFTATGHELFSYEGPFGVGYMEAVLYDSSHASQAADSASGRTSLSSSRMGDVGASFAPSDSVSGRASLPLSPSPPPRALLRIARDAISAHLHTRAYQAPELAEPWTRSRGVFVTLRTEDGELRGCVGHIEPACPTLAAEIASCAVSSAVHDTRFEPVARHELASLSIELSLLAPPEPVDDESALDPSRYGVVVTQGRLRGVLLPGIEGVDTAERQVDIAAAKGGIDLALPHGLERFEVVKLAEAPSEVRRHALN